MKKDGRTVVVVTHKPQMLSVVDKILVMSFGLTLAFGPRDAVLQSLRAPNLAVTGGNEKSQLQPAQPARA